MNKGRTTNVYNTCILFNEDILTTKNIGLWTKMTAEDDVNQYQYVQDNVIHIRNQPCVAHGKNPDTIPEAIVISLQFPFACAKDRIKPVAHKLYDEPECQNSKEDPLSGRLQTVKRSQTEAVQTQHNKFSAFQPHAFHKQTLPDFIRYGTPQKPYP